MNSTTGSRRHSLSEDERRVHRQALAGMLWSKQFYYFDLEKWLMEHKQPPAVGFASRSRACGIRSGFTC